MFVPRSAGLRSYFNRAHQSLRISGLISGLLRCLIAPSTETRKIQRKALSRKTQSSDAVETLCAFPSWRLRVDDFEYQPKYREQHSLLLKAMTNGASLENVYLLLARSIQHSYSIEPTISPTLMTSALAPCCPVISMIAFNRPEGAEAGGTVLVSA